MKKIKVDILTNSNSTELFKAKLDQKHPSSYIVDPKTKEHLHIVYNKHKLYNLTKTT